MMSADPVGSRPLKRFNGINTEPMPEGRATPEAAQHILITEIDRWAPIIRAVGEYADYS
jgi:putative tricarboxylic transport membrane protein